MKINIQPGDKIGIVGAGGLGKEVFCALGDMIGWDNLRSAATFLVEEKYFKHQEVLGIKVQSLAILNSIFDFIIIAIGDLEARMRIINMFPDNTQFATIIHPSVQQTPYTHIGKGSIVLGNVLLSCDVEIGKYALVNPGVTISHDTTIGNFFTASPGVSISGGCQLGDRVFLGTGACLRNSITIGDDVIVGMGAIVVGDLLKPGTYIGNPAKLI